MKKRVLSILVLTILLLAQFSIFTVAADTIKIGGTSSMVGILGSIGEMVLKGAQLAVDMANEDGGIHGQEVEYINIDGQSSQTVISNAAIRLIEEEDVLAGIGPVDINYLSAAAPIFENNETVLMDPTATTPSIAAMGDYIFMTPFGDDAQARALAKYVAEDLGFDNIAIIKDVNADYSITLAEHFIEAFKEFTGNDNPIAVEENYQTGDQDYTAQMTRIRQHKDIDALFIIPPLPQDAPVIANQARRFGIDVPIIYPDAGDFDEVIEIGEEAVEGAYISSHFAVEEAMTDLAAKFVEKYEAEHGYTPGGFEGLGFDSAQIILEAIRKINADEWKAMDLAAKRKAIQQSLNTNEFNNLIVPIKYQPNLPPTKPVVIKQIKNGERVFIKTMWPEDFAK
ncbi:MAG: ABC transporter substrate-binding protein [Bacillota bacterium]